MYTFQVDDVVSVFQSAKNPNSAVKHFLKREARPGDKSERFAKSLRDLLPIKNKERFVAFVNNSLPEYEIHWTVLCRYAHADALGQVVEEIFNRYADKFNETYEKQLQGINVKDEAEFKKIVVAVTNDLPALLSKAGLPDSGFVKNVVLHLTFEQEVLKLVAPIIRTL